MVSTLPHFRQCCINLACLRCHLAASYEVQSPSDSLADRLAGTLAPPPPRVAPHSCLPGKAVVAGSGIDSAGSVQWHSSPSQVATVCMACNQQLRGLSVDLEIGWWCWCAMTAV